MQNAFYISSLCSSYETKVWCKLMSAVITPHVIQKSFLSPPSPRKQSSQPISIGTVCLPRSFSSVQCNMILNSFPPYQTHKKVMVFIVTNNLLHFLPMDSNSILLVVETVNGNYSKESELLLYFFLLLNHLPY